MRAVSARYWPVVSAPFSTYSARSLAHGALFNVVRINLVALVLTVVPLLVLGRARRQGTPTASPR